MTPLTGRLADNLARVRERMAAACRRAGRPVDAARLVSVTKSAPLAAVAALVELGQFDLAENRPQQLLDRAGRIGPPARWHLIGHLQRNKARKILPIVERVHSVDSLRLLETLDGLAGELALKPRVLLEVNVSGEASKGGFAPEELLAGAEAVAACRRVMVEGLMTMAPWSDDPEAARPTFAALRAFRDRLSQRLAAPLSELSMGMSGDFEPAIEEGATLVRIGSSLFEGLTELEPPAE